MNSTPAEEPSASLQAYADPLSLGQKALWTLYRTVPESVAYNLSGAVAVPTDTNLVALRRAFRRLAERHPMLRTVFVVRGAEPVQRVRPHAEVDFCCEDASAWHPAQLDARLAAEIYRPFDLEHRTAWRVVTLRHAPLAADGAVSESGSSAEHLVLLVFHHLLGDLWSLAVMMAEVAALYQEATSGAPAALKPLRASYADHVMKEAQRLKDPSAESSWQYWHARLSGDVPVLALPTDRPRPTIPTGRGAAQSIAIDQDLTERLRQLAATHHVALHTVLLTAFQTLLHRYTGQDDVLVGVPKAGRSHAFARVVGYFVNLVVTRADFTANPRFVDLLHANQRASEEGAAHEWYPFSRVVQRLQPARDVGRSPLVQAMFSWQKTTQLLPREAAGSVALGQADVAVDLGGLRMRPVPLPHRVAPVDLTLAAADGPGRLVATIEYRTDLFEPATIARLAQSYRILLDSVVRDPEQLVARLAIMPDAERRELLQERNATAAPYPTDLCLHQLVEQQAERNPDALALVCEEHRLTYRALNQQANQLAHTLRRLGVGPDTPVGLLCTRSPHVLVGLLAILKAGGAYAPLDPSYPNERLAFMLRDSAAPLVLTERALRDRLAHLNVAGDREVRVLFLDAVSADSLESESADAHLIRAQPTTNPPSVTTPDHLAYLIYTSGSTGQPNGVALAHRGVVSLLSDFQRRGPLVPGDACSWWTSLSFDVAVYEIFSPWLAGATLHAIPEQVRLDAPALLTWLHTHQIRSAYLPPFLVADYARWVDSHPGGVPLRRLLVGVEPIPEHLLLHICAQLPELCLLNGYGPSETTICSTLYQVSAHVHAQMSATPAPTHQWTPIGRPVANTQVYVLDQHLQPVPTGIVGEVYIGGVGLARGYWRHPELTAARFVPDPFSAQPDAPPGGARPGVQPDGEPSAAVNSHAVPPQSPSARLYRTGDLARMLPNGNLEFAGRRDSQVKLRGNRIELGEIEAALAQHPNIKQVVVLLRSNEGHSGENPRGDQHLVAYLTPTEHPPPRPDELRRFLAQRLPQTMLPSGFVVLDAFPSTPSGKVDRRALATGASLAATQLQSDQERAVAQPCTEVERLLVTIWQQALGVEHMGVNDNFFALGGDSIVGLQVVARAAEAGLHLTPRHLFEAPTVRGLAALAEASSPVSIPPLILGRIQPEQGILEGAVPLTPLQRWFFERDFPDPHHWNQALLFATRQPLDPAHLRSTVVALLEHHDALRLRYIRKLTGWSQTYAGRSEGEGTPCVVVDLSALPASQQQRAIATHAAGLQCSLNLTAGPLVRVAYFDLGPARPGRLLIVIHHLAIDGVSWRILIDDLQTAYRQLQRGQSVRLPPKTTSYRDWAQRLVDVAQSPQIGAEADWWLHAASGGLPVLPVDQDRASCHRAPETTPTMPMTQAEASARRVSVCLGHDETHALLHDAPIFYGAGVNDVLVTALALAFQRWTGSSVLWLDLEGHGRDDLVDANGDTTDDTIDLSRTVGWFTALYPVRLDLPLSIAPELAVQAIKEQLRRVPHHGVGYGLLRYLCADPVLRERFKAIPPAHVSFNYLGQVQQVTADALLRLAIPQRVGPSRSPDAPRSHLLEVDVAIVEGELRSTWTYSAHVHHRHTIERLATAFTDELRALIIQHNGRALSSDARLEYAENTRHPACSEAVSYWAAERGLTGTAAAGQARMRVITDDTHHADDTDDTHNWTDVYPLSPMQQGMLVHTVIAPMSGLYVEQLTGDLEGALDIPAFTRAWERVLERHTILRSSFVCDRLDRMFQVVHQEVRVPLELLDWRTVSSAERAARLDTLLVAERRRGFDLTRAPLLRLVLLRTAEETYRFVLTYHHVVLDGWSVAVLFKEVFTLYAGFTQQEVPMLPPVRPYRDYIAWLQMQDREAAERFWRHLLTGCTAASTACAPPLCPLQDVSSLDATAVSRARATLPAEHETRLSTQTTAALRSLARKQHLTLNTIVQGALAFLLSRYAQQDEVLFGATVAGRPPDLPGSERMLGLFINTLPLRIRVDPQVHLIEWLQRLQHQASEARQYDYSSLSQIQAWSGVAHGTPLFETILVFENYPMDAAIEERASGLRLHDVRSIEQTNYPLAVVAVPGAQLQLKVVYDSVRYEPDVIHGVLGHLCQVLESMAADPAQLVAALSQLATAPSGRQAEAEQTAEQKAEWTQEQPGTQSRQAPSQAPPAPALAEAAAAAPTALERHLVHLWQELLALEHVGIHDDFFELGGNSLLGAVLIHRLQEALQEELALTAIFDRPTVSALAHYLDVHHPKGVARLLGRPRLVPSEGMATAAEATTEAMAAAPAAVVVLPSALIAIQPHGTRPPLFCIHPAGGIVFPYYTLAPYMGNDQPLYGLQDPDLYSKRSTMMSIEDMAARYVEVIKSVQSEGPYYLMGWSMGGLVAYEMAQQLARQGQVIAALILLDTAAPAHVTRQPLEASLRGCMQQLGAWILAWRTRGRMSRSAVKPILSYVRSGLFLLEATLRRKPAPSHRKPAALELLRWSGIDTWRTLLLNDAEVSSMVSREASLLLVEMPAVRRILELVHAHRQRARRYRASVYRGRVTLVRAIAADHGERRLDDPAMGWQDLAEAGVEICTIHANHVALLVKPYVETLARALKVCLEVGSSALNDAADRHEDD